jgi:hypothetical protein
MAIYFILLNVLALFFWLIDYHILGKNGIVKSFFKIRKDSGRFYTYYYFQLTNEEIQLTRTYDNEELQINIKNLIIRLCFAPLFSLILYFIISEKYWFFYAIKDKFIPYSLENKLGTMNTIYGSFVVLTFFSIISSLIFLNR